MKKATIILTALVALLCASCDKWADDQPLDGMWQLQSEKHQGTTKPKLEAQRYWSFRREIAQFSSPNVSRCYAHYKHEGNNLRFYNFVTAASYVTASDNNEWICPDSTHVLHPWGLYPVQDDAHPERVCVSYHIVTLHGDRMVLANETDTLTFRRF